MHLIIYTISAIGYFCITVFIFSEKTINSWSFCSATVHYDAVLSHILCIFVIWSLSLWLIVWLRLQNFAFTCQSNCEASTWALPTDRCETHQNVHLVPHGLCTVLDTLLRFVITVLFVSSCFFAFVSFVFPPFACSVSMSAAREEHRII